MKHPVMTVAQMKHWEAEQDRQGFSYARMMENAGSRAAMDMVRRFAQQEVLVLCGKGNNAGDGLVLARILASKGWPVNVMWLQGQQLSVLAEANRLQLPSEIQIVSVDKLTNCLSSVGMVVDAVYGTGFHSSLSPVIQQCFAAVGKSKSYKIALDMPSGVGGDGGIIADGCFQAQLTYVFQTLKPAHCLPEVQALCGEIKCVDLLD